MSDLHIALQALLFFLPAGISNMTPIIASKLPLLKKWNAPLDFDTEWNGHRVFGKNKTWRGLVSGTIMGTLSGFAIHALVFPELDLQTYLFASAAMSLGALLGDAIESFFKRQRGIASGSPWFPFDQTDYIIGGLALSLPFAIIELSLIPYIIGWYFGLHLVSSYIGYLLGFKDAPI